MLNKDSFIQNEKGTQKFGNKVDIHTILTDAVLEDEAVDEVLKQVCTLLIAYLFS